jgi:muramoyltetrapeptide carboxypeptidase
LNTASHLVKPPALRAGDTVAIVAPASAIERELLERGCSALRKLGYVPTYNESILESDLYFAGTPERRVREFHDMFARDDVRAILCARGGYGCNYLLPQIDVDLVRKHPKVFVGYSDVTTLLTWLHDAAGLVTFHGPMVTKDFAFTAGVDLNAWQAIVGGTAQSWTSDTLRPIVTGSAEGRLYGGCLSMLTASLGTPYEICTDGVILFIEDVDARPYQIDRMLMQLKLAGKLSNVRGIVFGVMQDCLPSRPVAYELIDVIRRVVEDLCVPVAFGLNSGHVKSGNLTLPLGVQASLVVQDQGGQLSILEPAVAPRAKG